MLSTGRKRIEVKLGRARAHLSALSSEIDAYAASAPAHIVTDFDSHAAVDLRWVEDIPAHWPAIAGDCVHNLRSALDHMVWQLSGGDGSAPPRSEFPIFLDEAKYLGRSATRMVDPKAGSGLAKIAGIVDPHVRRRIYRLQPFHAQDPTRHSLWLLHELDNIDKHRSLHVVLAYAWMNPRRIGIHDRSSIPPGYRQLTATASPTYPRPGPSRVRVKRRNDCVMSVKIECPSTGEVALEPLLEQLITYVQSDVLGQLGELL